MKEMIEYVLKSLVDHPDQVQLKELAGERMVMYEAKVADGDQAKVIGRHGRTIDAIRAIVDAAAKKQGKHGQFELIN